MLDGIAEGIAEVLFDVVLEAGWDVLQLAFEYLSGSGKRGGS